MQSSQICAIYSSDLQRTLQTAQTVAQALQLQVRFTRNMALQHVMTFLILMFASQVVPVKELRERHLGVLQGLTKTEAAQQQSAAYACLGGSPDSRIPVSLDTPASSSVDVKRLLIAYHSCNKHMHGSMSCRNVLVQTVRL